MEPPESLPEEGGGAVQVRRGRGSDSEQNCCGIV